MRLTPIQGRGGDQQEIDVVVETQWIAGLEVERAPARRPRVLFVHGAGAGSWTWSNFMRQFQEAGYDCYAMNLRGHAPNPPIPSLGELTLQDYADDVRKVLAEIGEDVVLVGHSMGGAIAQLVGQDARLRALVLAASAPLAGVRFQPPPLNLSLLAASLRAYPTLIRRQPLKPRWRVIRHAALNCLPPDQQREVFAKMVPESAAVGVQVYRGEVAADLTRVDYPILVISGTHDQTSILTMEREIAEQRGADMIELDRRGHMFMLEPGWEECGRKILDWLREKGI